MRVRCIAFTVEASKQDLKSVKMKIRYIRAFHGHSSGINISPRLMNYVMIPCKWKQFIFHNVGRADLYSIAEVGLVAGGKEHKEGKQTLFFTPRDPFNSYASEMEAIAEIKKPKKVYYQIHVSNELDSQVKAQCSGFSADHLPLMSPTRTTR